MKKQPLKILISGGGTGGHVFPAIAIADALKSVDDKAQILFVGAKGRMEMEKVPQAGYPIIGLNITGFQRKWAFSNFIFPFRLTFSLVKAFSIIRSFRPHVVVGVGGYASGPTLRMAAMMKIPSLIQEQNSYPGITNRMLGKKVNTVCVAYDQMEHWFQASKTILAGNPVRKTTVEITNKRDEALQFFNLNNALSSILVIGGSQGALAINNAIIDKLYLLSNQPVQLIWQTGKTSFAEAQSAVEKAGLTDRIKVLPFIERMDLAYAAANLIISRAGAIAIAEISLVRKAAILVPLPTAAENHQHNNAMRLVEAGAAMLINNDEASEKLIPTAIGLISQAETLAQMEANIAAFGHPEAAKTIAEEVIKLAKQ